MKFETCIAHKIDNDKWNDSLLQSDSSSAFQTSRLLKPYQESYGSKPVFISVLDENKKIVGQLAAIIHNKMWWMDANILSRNIGSRLNLRSFLTWNYGPVIHDYEHKEEIAEMIVSSLDEIISSNNVALISGSSPPLSNSNLDAIFTNHGYSLEPWATYIIDLPQSIGVLYNKLDKKTRYDIRKSEKNNLEFEVSEKRSALDEYKELKNISKIHNKEKLGLKKHDLFWESYWNEMYEKGFAKIFFAKLDGEFLAGLIALLFNKNLIQENVATNPKKTDLLGGPFLTWNTIKWSIDNGFRTYDMGGVDPFPKDDKVKQINFYKAKWGGTKRELIMYKKITSKTKVRISSALRFPERIPAKLIHLR